VRFWGNIIAVVLLTIWLPATQHCGLENAGLIAADASATCCESAAAAHSCAHDACQTVEDGLAKPALTSLKISAPRLLACVAFLCPRLLTADVPAGAPRASFLAARPRDWVPGWHFARRAAPSPRAPSLVS